MTTSEHDANGQTTPDGSGVAGLYRCHRCQQVHDATVVEKIARYTDCTVWKCPHCGSLIDDRPISLGGSAEHLLG